MTTSYMYTTKYNRRLAYIAQQGTVIAQTEHFNRKPGIKTLW